ncbi:MAG: sodium:solute symporter family protein [Planctomycetes bacterium]|nr:sodium:solute symporter family protein [Planctomycetota bacterium]
MLAAMSGGQTAVIVIAVYLSLLLILGVISSRFLRGSAADYFLASRGIGSFLLVMSLFGTTMTAFALVGSTGEAFRSGIGVYGKMASWSGIVHSACFFFIGIKLWSFGKRYGYVTQIQFFRDRFESNGIGLLLFPLLVGLVIPYLLIGVLSAGTVINKITAGAFPTFFAETGGAIPFAVGSGIICLVVLVYVFLGGVRGTAWANAFQTMVFIVLGLVTFLVLADKLGGIVEATNLVREHNPTRLKRDVTPADIERYETRLAEWEKDPTAAVIKPAEPHRTPPLMFLSYAFIPLSVGMFPHLFQHWLTARSAKTFRLAVVAHPLLIMIVWVPCVLIGIWATSAVVNGHAVIPVGMSNPNAVLAVMVKQLTSPILGALLTAGILAAIMSSLDSQFLCLGSIFANDIVGHYISRDRLTDRQKVTLGRIFVVGIVVVTYVIGLRLEGVKSVFTLGVWCFSGFASLFPLVVASLYWKRVTKAGAYAGVLTTAVAWIWLFAQSDYGGNREYLFLGMMPVVTMTCATAAALVIVSLFTTPPSTETIAKFFGKTEHGR